MNAATFEPQSLIDLRLVLAVVIAMIVHAMVVLGVRLPAEAPVKARFEAMEVVLVPATIPVLSAVSENTAADTPAAAAVAKEPPLVAAPPVERPAVKAAAVSLPKPAPIKPAPVSPAPPQRAPPLTPAAPAAEKITPTTAPPATAPLLPTAAQLIERSMAIAATGAGLIEEKTVSGQSRAERTHHIKSKTRDFAEITYKAEVRDRINRFGGLFQRPVPAGTATVSITIGVDGSLLDAHIVRSSHVAATDEEILRIVNLAAPYGALWPERARISDGVHFDQPITIDQEGGFSHGQ